MIKPKQIIKMILRQNKQKVKIQHPICNLTVSLNNIEPISINNSNNNRSNANTNKTNIVMIEQQNQDGMPNILVPVLGNASNRQMIGSQILSNQANYENRKNVIGIVNPNKMQKIRRNSNLSFNSTSGNISNGISSMKQAGLNGNASNVNINTTINYYKQKLNYTNRIERKRKCHYYIQNQENCQQPHKQKQMHLELELESLKTICAKRISLSDNRQRNKKSNSKSASSHYCNNQCAHCSNQLCPSRYKQSNFSILKQQAKILEQQQQFQALRKWKQNPAMNLNFNLNCNDNNQLSNNAQNLSQYSDQPQDAAIVQSMRKYKKGNMRKIIKGRPEIKHLLQNNKNSIGNTILSSGLNESKTYENQAGYTKKQQRSHKTHKTTELVQCMQLDMHEPEVRLIKNRKSAQKQQTDHNFQQKNSSKTINSNSSNKQTNISKQTVKHALSTRKQNIVQKNDKNLGIQQQIIKQVPHDLAINLNLRTHHGTNVVTDTNNSNRATNRIFRYQYRHRKISSTSSITDTNINKNIQIVDSSKCQQNLKREHRYCQPKENESEWVMGRQLHTIQ